MRASAFKALIAGVIVALVMSCAHPTRETDSARVVPAAADDEPWPSLCDLVEEALLASAEKPKPSNDFWQRERARENIERIKRQVQHLRDTDRCG